MNLKICLAFSYCYHFVFFLFKSRLSNLYHLFRKQCSTKTQMYFFVHSLTRGCNAYLNKSVLYKMMKVIKLFSHIQYPNYKINVITRSHVLRGHYVQTFQLWQVRIIHGNPIKSSQTTLWKFPIVIQISISRNQNDWEVWPQGWASLHSTHSDDEVGHMFEGGCNWRGLSPAMDCYRLMMIKINRDKNKFGIFFIDGMILVLSWC